MNAWCTFCTMYMPAFLTMPSLASLSMQWTFSRERERAKAQDVSQHSFICSSFTAISHFCLKINGECWGWSLIQSIYFVSTEQLAFRKYLRISDLERRCRPWQLLPPPKNCYGTCPLHCWINKTRLALCHLWSKVFLLTDGSIYWPEQCWQHSSASSLVWPEWWWWTQGWALCVCTSLMISPQMGCFNHCSMSCNVLAFSRSLVTCSKLKGIAADGTAANVVHGGLKVLVEMELEWIFWM